VAELLSHHSERFEQVELPQHNLKPFEIRVLNQEVL
jgi:hypothetical protein